MFSFLHTFNPSPILFSVGPVHLYWYGLFMVLAVLSALGIAIYLAKFYNIKLETMVDLALYLIIGGLLGGRLYHVLLELPYYLASPTAIFKIWQGGLAIHGALIGGLLALFFFTKRHRATLNFLPFLAIVVTALPLGQAIGRWGNYFNQELFGLPTNLPWGIPISPANRPWPYLDSAYFHPAFLYESLGNLIIFILLIGLQFLSIKKNRLNNRFYLLLFSVYLIFYSVLRFFMEFLRIDSTPLFLGWRWPQLVSLFIILLCLLGWTLKPLFNNRFSRPLEK
jgi:phosphatidylglycerol---prolipoprotein diacylglyceryl transferase